jgi:hypothetical protein
MRRNWYLTIGIVLVATFAAGLIFALLVFGRSRETLYLLVLDLISLPLNALVVTLFIDRLLQVRERHELGQRINIVIGVFFNEMGMDLLRYLSLFDRSLDEMRNIAAVDENWSRRDFANMKQRLESYHYTIDCHCAELGDLKALLQENHDFLLSLLSNASLLEHEAFTELLWAIMHVSRELEMRENLDDLPDEDYAHLGEDMRRVYVLLVKEWLSFVERLKISRPYSFSLAVRLNPFAENPSAVVED